MTYKYSVSKTNQGVTYTHNDDKLTGFIIKSSKNNKQQVLILIKNEFIRKILNKKVNKKIKQFMAQLIADYDESGDSEGDGLNQILNQSKRFRSILRNEYAKYLTNLEIANAIKKITIIERETLLRMSTKELEKNNNYNKGPHL